MPTLTAFGDTAMVTIEDLLNLVKEKRSDVNLNIIRSAYEFAERLHGDQRRISGEPYIIHPLNVAMILASMHLDENAISAALLHDIVEDTSASLEEIERDFSPEIAMLVDGVTKLTAFTSEEHHFTSVLKSRADRQAENLRKIFLAMAKDVRVILIKLADRLHNMRTLKFMKREKQIQIARETLDIFAAIASRLGMWKLKWELEDLSFSYLEPEEYNKLKTLVDEKMVAQEKIIQDAISIIERELKGHGVQAKISGRRKHIYSTYQKISQRGKEFSEIYDLFAIRVIVNTVEECYKVLGAVHRLWIPMKGRIKDYIARPKSNSYRSLHTTIYGPGEEPLEIQIRTFEMHHINEYGLAAHWAYKENKELTSAQEDYPWVRRIVDWQNDSKDARDYIENLRLDLNESEVFVYTPRGDAIDLPAGSTPIDFAYRIHTHVGHQCVGAKVNARIVPLEYRLQNGDRVEIITSKHATPSLDWLNLCRSNHTKMKIRQWFKKERREENILRGREILEKELKRQRIDKVLSDVEMFEKIAQKLNFSSVDDLIASLGYGETSITQLLTRIKDEMPKEVDEVLVAPRRVSTRKEKLSKGVRVKGVDNILVVFAKCCNPVPGDDIVGHWKFGTGVSVHRRNCPNIQEDRVTEVWWEGKNDSRRYPVELEIEAWDRRGLLAELMNVVNDSRIPASSCSARVKKNKAVVSISIDVIDKVQLNDLLRKLTKVSGVLSASRASACDDSIPLY